MQIASVHIRIVTKIALITGLSAAIALISIAWWSSSPDDNSYFQLIQSQSITQKTFGSVFIVTATLLLLFVSLLTWLVAVYSSFRFAGPLYRFRHNFQAILEGNKTTPIRKDDHFQAEHGKLEQKLSDLQMYYRDIQQLARQAKDKIEDPNPKKDNELQSYIVKLSNRLNTIHDQ